jgi:preprotein translocase SecE subunit
MARQEFKKPDRSGPAAALATKENRMARTDDDNDRDDTTYADRSSTLAHSAAPSRGFFDFYKPGQGYYTRVWTGIASGVLICWFAYVLYEKFALVGAPETAKYIQVGAATASIIIFGLLGYWALALNRKVCDFLIATEGEMKKVNWTSRKEIIGSTKVVIFVMLSLAIVLFIVDTSFILFFNGIGVLKGGALFDTLRKMIGMK